MAAAETEEPQVEVQVVEPRLLPDHGAAAYLAISLRKLWQLTKCGDIPCIRIGRAKRYDQQELDAWIEQQK